jgi:hypothetical protein
MDLKPPHLVIALRNTNKEEEGEHGAKQGEGGNGCSN